MSEQKIPKIIHYCWFGRGKKNELIEKCIASWKKYLPEYEIIEWNEDNFDIESNAYVKEAYEAKKWAFVTDYVRLYVMYNYGGIYMDTDVEVLKSLDEFLVNEAFLGFEARDCIQTGIMASIKGQTVVKELLQMYDEMKFLKNDGSYNMTTNVITITNYFINSGLKTNNKKQFINGFAIYPQIYFCPNTIAMIFDKNSSGSYTIHHFDSSWKDDKRKKDLKYKVRHYLVGIYRNVFGTKGIQK